MSVIGSLPFGQAEIDEESRRIRRLRIVVNLSLSLIAQGDLPFSEAQELAAAPRRLAEALFPGKGNVYDLLYAPKFRRLMNDVYRLQ
jgi:predicted HTH domain antitoxin